MEKKKKLDVPRLTTLPFMLIWVGAHVLVWIILFGFTKMDFLWGWPDIIMLTLFGLIIGLGLSLMQKTLIAYTFHAPLRWWLRVTVGGWIAGWFVFWVMIEGMEYVFDYSLGLGLMPLFVIPAALQWWILRRHARDAWLWVIAGAASALAFGAVYGDMTNDSYFQFAIGGAAQGAVTGLSLLWLYAQTRAGKVKSEFMQVN